MVTGPAACTQFEVQHAAYGLGFRVIPLSRLGLGVPHVGQHLADASLCALAISGMSSVGMPTQRLKRGSPKPDTIRRIEPAPAQEP